MILKHHVCSDGAILPLVSGFTTQYFKVTYIWDVQTFLQAFLQYPSEKTISFICTLNSPQKSIK